MKSKFVIFLSLFFMIFGQVALSMDKEPSNITNEKFYTALLAEDLETAKRVAHNNPNLAFNFQFGCFFGVDSTVIIEKIANVTNTLEMLKIDHSLPIFSTFEELLKASTRTVIKYDYSASR